MSTEGRLGPKKLRKVESYVGKPLHRAFAWFPYYEAVTVDDEHYYVHQKTGEVELKKPHPKWGTTHYSSCPSVDPTAKSTYELGN